MLKDPSITTYLFQNTLQKLIHDKDMQNNFMKRYINMYKSPIGKYGRLCFSLYKDAVLINITPASKNETYATSDAVPWFFTPMPTNAQTNTSGYM